MVQKNQWNKTWVIYSITCLSTSLFILLNTHLSSALILCLSCLSILFSLSLLCLLPFNQLVIIKWSSFLATVYLLTVYWLSWFKKRQEKNPTKFNCFIFKLDSQFVNWERMGWGECVWNRLRSFHFHLGEFFCIESTEKEWTRVISACLQCRALKQWSGVKRLRSNPYTPLCKSYDFEQVNLSPRITISASGI